MRWFIVGMAVLGLMCANAEARGRSGHSREARGFATGHCKTDSCYSKHPGGSYVHPITGRRR